MNKNRIEGVADQGERATNREALVIKGKRRKSGGEPGQSFHYRVAIVKSTKANRALGDRLVYPTTVQEFRSRVGDAPTSSMLVDRNKPLTE
jgi:hypothetical protein